jgi:hypothetical protein
MWDGCSIGMMSFLFKALGRQPSVAPIVAAMAFDDGSFARLQVKNQCIDFGNRPMCA